MSASAAYLPDYWNYRVGRVTDVRLSETGETIVGAHYDEHGRMEIRAHALRVVREPIIGDVVRFLSIDAVPREYHGRTAHVMEDIGNGRWRVRVDTPDGRMHMVAALPAWVRPTAEEL